MSRRTLIGGAAGVVVAAGAGTSWAVDRFLVEHVQIDDVTTYEAQQGGTATTAASDGKVSDNAFTSSDVSLGISRHTSGSGSDTVTWFVAEVELASATALRSAFAQNEFGTNVIDEPSAIATQNGAVFAVNGDYYGFRDTGIVIRNGVLYRDLGAREGLAFYRDGTAGLYDETTTSGKRLLADGVWHTLSFGPGIVDAGRAVAGIDQIEIDTNVGNHSIQGAQPRTGIGLIDDNHLVLVVVDGRSNGYSRGMTLPEFAGLFTGLGCRVAYNLDGGGSSTMWFDGSVVNNPLGKGQERGTSDILYLQG